MPYTIQQVARLAGVTVRALHHWDAVGLLRPAARTDAGYRLYGEAELLRLQRILLYRELGFPLSEVAELLERDGADVAAALERQREALVRRRASLGRLIETVDRTLARVRGETMLKDEELYEGFSPETIESIKAEAEARWGDTYRETDRRVRGWSKEKLAQVKASGEAIEHELAAALRAGEPADGAVAQALAARWVEHLRSFYEPTKEIVAGLGEMYVADERFRERYEGIEPGLAAYFREVLRRSVS